MQLHCKGKTDRWKTGDLRLQVQSPALFNPDLPAERAAREACVFSRESAAGWSVDGGT